MEYWEHCRKRERTEGTATKRSHLVSTAATIEQHCSSSDSGAAIETPIYLLSYWITTNGIIVG